MVYSTGASSSLQCVAHGGDGQFFIPPFVLLSMPGVSSASTQNFGDLSLSVQTTPTVFTAPGIDIGFGIGSSGIGISTVYKQ